MGINDSELKLMIKFAQFCKLPSLFIAFDLSPGKFRDVFSSLGSFTISHSNFRSSTAPWFELSVVWDHRDAEHQRCRNRDDWLWKTKQNEKPVNSEEVWKKIS